MAEGFLTEHAPVPGYEVVRYLGRNGAIIYLARQLSSGKQVVLKVYEPWFAESVQRYEAPLARLDHPNIVRVFEIGEVEGRVYAAMEYVSDRTLADRLREGPLSVPEAAALTWTIALTLKYARDQGMTHINLTPNSIWLSDEGAPKLFDFQLMEVVEQWDERKSAAIIRPAFSAPEEISGGRHSVSPTAAVYRVGAVMYTMLTGQPPFVGSSLLETLTAALERPPKRPRQLNAAVSRAAEKVCMKCLEMQPERRYASLQELADHLGRLMKTSLLRLKLVR
jgi:serine/threonine-protein kinase